MKIDKKIIVNIVIGLALWALLIITYVLGDKISPNNVGTPYDIEKAFRAIIVVLMGIVIFRLIMLVFINPFEKKRGLPIRNVIKYAMCVAIMIIASLIIITQLYGESAVIIWSFLATIGLGLAYAGKDLLGDVIAGIIIDIRGTVKVGDWIKIPDGSSARDGLVGKVERITTTHTELLLLDETLVFISNGKILGNTLINLNRPEKEFYSGIKVVLEHSIPVDRARRILYAAAANVEGTAEKSAFVVSDSVQQNGIVYGVYIKAINYDTLREVLHQLISSVTKYLHNHNLKLCEISGEFKIHHIDKNEKIVFDDSYSTNELNTLVLSGLLNGCSDKLKKEFSQNMKKLSFKTGETIVSQGDSGDTMFMISEGVVDVFMTVSVENKALVKHLATLSDGDYFGEMALLKGEIRNSTVITQTDTVIYEINRETIKNFVNQYPEFARKLSQSIIKRRIENEDIKSSALEKLNESENVVSEFMDSFKSFLGV